MKINLRQEIAMWGLGLLWTGLALFGFVSVGADVNAMLAFLPIMLVLLVPISLTIFSLRDRELKHHLDLAVVEDTDIGRVRGREKPFQAPSLIQDGFSFALVLLNLFRFRFSLAHESRPFHPAVDFDCT